MDPSLNKNWLPANCRPKFNDFTIKDNIFNTISWHAEPSFFDKEYQSHNSADF